MDPRRCTSQLAEVYLKERRRRGELCELTVRNDRSILQEFARLTNKPIDRVRQRDVELWLESLEELAPATRRGHYSVVRVFLRWCVQRKHLAADPCLQVRSPRQPRTIPRALSRDHVRSLLGSCPDTRARLIVLLMVQQGLRCCEVATLQMGDIDRVDGMMRIRGKGGHERILPILEETAEALSAYLDGQRIVAGPVILSRLDFGTGLNADTISGLVGRWLIDAGVKRYRRDGVSAHALRHTCATDMLKGGAHLRDVQYALGHRHLSTTEIYLPYVVHGLAKAMGGRRYGSGLAPLAEAAS